MARHLYPIPSTRFPGIDAGRIEFKISLVNSIVTVSIKFDSVRRPAAKNFRSKAGKKKTTERNGEKRTGTNWRDYDWDCTGLMVVGGHRRSFNLGLIWLAAPLRTDYVLTTLSGRL